MAKGTLILITPEWLKSEEGIKWNAKITRRNEEIVAEVFNKLVVP